MANSLVIVNTGCANISSVKFAFERLGSSVEVSDDVTIISKAQRVLLPGVGSAPAAMKSIRKKQLVDCLRSLTQPTLGVCLGMQLMVNDSQEGEFGKTELTDCLGLMPGRVHRMQVGNQRLPHMGWNKVSSKYDNPLFKGIGDGEHFYFVHSFAVNEYEHTLATCEYGNNAIEQENSFSAAIHKNNFFGVQFHPERSSDAGAHLLQNFIQL
ncbi:imidazole glycerol phosphate synthase subunit HisH [Glaciecola sp. MH2013]|uniref:imidazole glycerol phosphate synthase subunit HisH n=1 Tax=Glaciecola sp. MH2013 TaxID=2785524 RepID=UPI00189E183A|nr:imidazole glycerol phosphate synthase subunit HisH [Glaciecola sp. MH2013]MBF7073291.1 imidazole glycerol phosphate synthase subunit HisH [Glaciecola sp. MH2013]